MVPERHFGLRYVLAFLAKKQQKLMEKQASLPYASAREENSADPAAHNDKSSAEGKTVPFGNVLASFRFVSNGDEPSKLSLE